MAEHSHIQWTDTTWNPVVGCRKVSPGCDGCYAIRDAHRMAGNPNPKVSNVYAGLTQIQNGRPNWIGHARTVPDRLEEPLHWRKPRRVFVNSMSDLFHEDVPDEFIDRVFGVMALAARHTFQVLTKRPERMAHYLNAFCRHWADDTHDSPRTREWMVDDAAIGISRGKCGLFDWPLSNVLLGFSAENQEWFDRRAMQTASLMRAGWRVFASAEPLLGPIVMQGWDGKLSRNWLGTPGISWVIVGGESGPGARFCDLEWIRSIRNQCQTAQVPVFVKQLGAFILAPTERRDEDGDPVCVWDGKNFRDGYVRPLLRDKKGGDWSEWPTGLRVREMPV